MSAEASSINLSNKMLGADLHKSVSDEHSEIFDAWRQRRQSIKSSEEGLLNPGQGGRLGRRRSTFKGVAQSISGMISLRRLTKHRLSVSLVDTKPKITYENTYKTKPDSGKEPKVKKVEDMVHTILEHFLKEEKYSPENCSKLACDISILIKNKIKAMDFPRYKIVCNVVIGQCFNQGMQTASRCLWDASTDNFCTVDYKNNSLCAVVTVHFVYFE